MVIKRADIMTYRLKYRQISQVKTMALGGAADMSGVSRF